MTKSLPCINCIKRLDQKLPACSYHPGATCAYCLQDSVTCKPVPRSRFEQTHFVVRYDRRHAAHARSDSNDLWRKLHRRVEKLYMRPQMRSRINACSNKRKHKSLHHYRQSPKAKLAHAGKTILVQRTMIRTLLRAVLANAKPHEQYMTKTHSPQSDHAYPHEDNESDDSVTFEGYAVDGDDLNIAD